jgi:hydrogenase nickel incorporation protein HypB
VAVVEGDVQTDNDARRIAATGVAAVQIVTNGGCHLDASLVRDALERLDPNAVDLLFVENVGNLVCPAGFDLGENAKVVIASTTEGDDKPEKYPHAFRAARACVINKTDLLPHVDFDVERFKAHASRVNPSLRFFETSARTGAGVDAWCGWLVDVAAAPREV